MSIQNTKCQSSWHSFRIKRNLVLAQFWMVLIQLLVWQKITATPHQKEAKSLQVAPKLMSQTFTSHLIRSMRNNKTVFLNIGHLKPLKFTVHLYLRNKVQARMISQKKSRRLLRNHSDEKRLKPVSLLARNHQEKKLSMIVSKFLIWRTSSKEIKWTKMKSFSVNQHEIRKTKRLTYLCRADRLPESE